MKYATAIALAAFAGAFYVKGHDVVDSVTVELPAFEKYDDLFKKYGNQFDVPWRWLKAIAMNESSLGLNPLVAAGQVSSDGLSYGLMQLTLTTAADMMSGVTSDDLNNPETSVMLAARYVRHLMNLFHDDKRKTIMSYNQGPGNTQKGKEYAADYYDRFDRNIQRILEKQPGDELETS